ANSGAAERPRRALVSRGPLRLGSTIIAQNSGTRRGMLDHPSCDRRTPGASLRAFTPVFDGLWTRVNALKARWKAACAITILMAWNSQLEDPHVQAKGRAMALDDKPPPHPQAPPFPP